MEHVTISADGQIILPAAVRDALKLSPGTELLLDVRGQEIVLVKEPAWKKLRGIAAASMEEFTDFRRRERQFEDSCS